MANIAGFVLLVVVVAGVVDHVHSYCCFGYRQGTAYHADIKCGNCEPKRWWNCCGNSPCNIGCCGCNSCSSGSCGSDRKRREADGNTTMVGEGSAEYLVFLGDSDRDGRLTLKEMHVYLEKTNGFMDKSRVRQLHALDSNRDGYLTVEEIDPVQPETHV